MCWSPQDVFLAILLPDGSVKVCRGREREREREIKR